MNKFGMILIFGGISFVFIFMGTNMTGPLGPGHAARVNNGTITLNEYRDEAERMLNFYSQMFGENMELSTQQRQRIQSSALENLITQEATAQVAEKEGLLVVDREISDTITGIPAFQQDGRFVRQRYDQYLKNRKMKPTHFEDQIRRQLSVSKTRNLFTQTLSPSTKEIEKEWVAQETKVNVQYAKIDQAKLGQSLKVSDKELTDFLASTENKSKVKEHYNVNKTKYTTKEEVHARHILIKTIPANPDSEKQALAKIQEISKRAQNEDFGKIASELSEDLGTKSKGGDLGYFERGRMVPAFEKVAFTLEPGKISDPVKTQFGYHLIRVEDKKGAKTTPFESVEKQVAKEMLLEEKVDAKLEELKAALTSGDKAAADKVIGNLGVKWEETGDFSISAERLPKIGVAEGVLKAVFSLKPEKPLYKDLVQEGEFSYALNLKALKKPDTLKPKDESFTTRITNARMRDAFTSWASKIVKSSEVERNTSLLR